VLRVLGEFECGVLGGGSLYELNSACDEVQDVDFPEPFGAEDGYMQVRAMKVQKGGSQFGLEKDRG